MDGSECISCAQCFTLNYNSTACVRPAGFLNDQCLENSTIDFGNDEKATEVSCNSCKENAVPYDFQYQFACLIAAEIREIAELDNDSKIVTNCTKYHENLTCIQCDITSSTPYLNVTIGNKSCVAECSESYFKYILDNSYQVYLLNVCYDPDIIEFDVSVEDNCLIYGPDLTDRDGTASYICIKCKSNMITVLDPAEERYSNIDPDATILDKFFPSANSKYPAVSCVPVDSTNKIGTTSSTTFISNCKYYMAHSATQFSCLKCNQGFKGRINSSNYIFACDRDSSCTTDVFYNLDAFTNNLSSCHKCTSSTLIPFIAYRAGSSDGTDISFDQFAQYDLTISSGYFENAVGTGKGIACRNNRYSSFGISDSNYKIDANCGIGVLLVNTTGSSNGSTTYGNYCAACKPGYKINSSGSAINKSCTLISQCSSNNTFFNGCSECATGYIIEFNQTNNTIPYDKCLAIPSASADRFAIVTLLLQVDLIHQLPEAVNTVKRVTTSIETEFAK